MTSKFSDVLEKIENMPEPPRSAVQAVSMLEDPDIPISAISEFISLDQCLTTKILKLSNLACYGYSRRVATIKEAMMRVGTNAIKYALYSSMLEMSGFRYNPFFAELWKSSLFTAFVAKDMGERIGHPRPELCFTGGLLCDTGQLLLNEFDTNIYTNLVREVLKEQLDIVEAEHQVFGFTHVQLGYKIADLWRFPVTYRNVIRYHHNPVDANSKLSANDYKLAVAVHVANSLSPLFGEQSGNNISWASVRQAGLYISRSFLLDSLREKFEFYYQEIARITDIMFDNN